MASRGMEKGDSMDYAEKIKQADIVPHIVNLFETAGIKQFESLDRHVELVNKSSKDDDVLECYIDVGSADLTVALLLRAPRSILIKTIPGVPVGEDNTREMLEDWVLELANRLIGRLKNKLISHSCKLQMGLPKTGVEKNVQELFDAVGGKVTPFFFDMQGETIDCYLSINLINEALEIDLYEDEDEDWFDESELEHL